MKHDITQYLFKDAAACSVLTAQEVQAKRRYELCITRRMDNPLTLDRDLVEYLQQGCDGIVEPVSKSQAYRDVAAITQITGNIALASKNWYRHLIIEGAKEIYAMAMRKEDSKGAAAALDKLGKYTRCNKDDEAMDWSEMLPPVFEPSDDLTLVEGLKAIPTDELEARRKHLRELFLGLGSQAEEAKYEEVSDE